MLIGSYFGKQIMVASPLLKWYCTHGLIVENITTFIEYEPVACFQNFTQEVSNAHRKADIDRSGTAAGNTAKLIGKLIFFLIQKSYKCGHWTFQKKCSPLAKYTLPLAKYTYTWQKVMLGL